MPQLYNFGNYVIYFWVNEGIPTEPIHVHVAERRPIPDGTKLWITKSGKTLVCHNKSRISDNRIRQLCRFIEASMLSASRNNHKAVPVLPGPCLFGLRKTEALPAGWRYFVPETWNSLRIRDAHKTFHFSDSLLR